MSTTFVNEHYLMRTVVYDAVQAVRADFDLLVTPTLSAMPVLNADGPGATVGPSEVEGVDVDPFIGWCPTYFSNSTGHARGIHPRRARGRLAGGHVNQGRRYADSAVLAASGAFERLRPWAESCEICRSRTM